MLFTTCQNEPVKLVLGIGQYNTEGEAESESFESYGLPMPELVAAYRIVLHKHPNYINDSQTKIVLINKITVVNDGGSADLTNHNLFTDRFNGIQHPTSAIVGLDQALAEAGKLKDIEMVGTMKSVLTINEITRDAKLNTFQSNSKNMPAIYGGGNEFGESRVLVSEVGSDFSPAGADGWSEVGGGFSRGGDVGGEFSPAIADMWSGAALALNGKIYCPATMAEQVLEIDPETEKTTLIGSVYSGHAKWHGIALASNGKLYCPPRTAGTQVLEIDPITKTTTLIGSVYSGTNKWLSIANSSVNGKLYCPPFDYGLFLEIDPVTKVTTTFGSGFGGTYFSIIDGKDGFMYSANDTRIVKINPINKAISSITKPANYQKLHFLILGKDKKIYCIPNSSESVILKYDPQTNIFRRFTTFETLADQGGFWGGALGADGKLYLCPEGYPYFVCIDTEKESFEIIEQPVAGYEGGHMRGLVLAPNGNLYTDVSFTNRVHKLDTFPKSVDFQKYLLLPKNIIN